MKRTRFEILLPLRYDDGERIAKQKFAQTQQEILHQIDLWITTHTLNAV